MIWAAFIFGAFLSGSIPFGNFTGIHGFQRYLGRPSTRFVTSI